LPSWSMSLRWLPTKNYVFEMKGWRELSRKLLLRNLPRMPGWHSCKGQARTSHNSSQRLMSDWKQREGVSCKCARVLNVMEMKNPGSSSGLSDGKWQLWLFSSWEC
jgi:hypothetical protein